MRGGKEHRDLCLENIKLKNDEDGKLEFLLYSERQTKTRTGENPHDIRSVKPRTCETPASKETFPVTL